MAKYHILWAFYRREEGPKGERRVITDVRALCDRENQKRRVDLLKARFVRNLASRFADMSFYRDVSDGCHVGSDFVCRHCKERLTKAREGEVLG